MVSITEIKQLSVDTAKSGMLPSVFAAQAILESGVFKGGSTLARDYNNYFGIKKGSSWTGKTVTLSTKENYNGIDVYIKDEFRVYDTPRQSFEDRVNLLLNSSRYKDVYTYDTPEEQAKALQRAGYATDPNYASKLIQIIDTHNLRELDKKKKNMKTIQIIVLVLALSIVVATTYSLVTR